MPYQLHEVANTIIAGVMNALAVSISAINVVIRWLECHPGTGTWIQGGVTILAIYSAYAASRKIQERDIKWRIDDIRLRNIKMAQSISLELCIISKLLIGIDMAEEFERWASHLENNDSLPVGWKTASIDNKYTSIYNNICGDIIHVDDNLARRVVEVYINIFNIIDVLHTENDHDRNTVNRLLASRYIKRNDVCEESAIYRIDKVNVIRMLKDRAIWIKNTAKDAEMIAIDLQEKARSMQSPDNEKAV